MTIGTFFSSVWTKITTVFAPFVKAEAASALTEFEAFAKQYAGAALGIVETVALNPLLTTPEAKLGAATALLLAELVKEGIPASTTAIQTLIQNAVVVFKLNSGAKLLG